MAPGRKNGLSKPQTSLLHAVCACNYIKLPLTRQHKQSVFVSRFTPSRHFCRILQFFSMARFQTKKNTTVRIAHKKQHDCGVDLSQK